MYIPKWKNNCLRCSEDFSVLYKNRKLLRLCPKCRRTVSDYVSVTAYINIKSFDSILEDFSKLFEVF